VTFQGTTTFEPTPSGRDKVLLTIAGKNVQIIGAPGSKINGNGQAYWDGQGGNGGRKKPKFFRLKLSDSVIQGLHVVNVPVHVFSIGNCHNLVLDHIQIDNTAGEKLASNKKTLGHNTDAFDVGESSNITISNAYVHNQDDCLAVNSGTDITFINGTCIGGHGLSIGSVGGRNNNTVRKVRILNSKIIKSDNGVRIKTKANKGKGLVTDITYSNIELDGITKRGIVIQQDYENSGPTGRPGGDVHISGVTLKDITGRVNSGAKAVYVLCAQGGCTDWNWSGVRISGGSRSCQGVPAGARQYC